MINSLLGRKSRTIWTRGYNPMKIAGPEKAKERIAYLYNNPTKAGLEDTIEAYPGLKQLAGFPLRRRQQDSNQSPPQQSPCPENPCNLNFRSKKTAQSP